MRAIVTTMKDEGPFILEWVAHHLSIGFDHVFLASNDCSDGTDKIALRLQELGHVTHLDNPGPWKHGPQGGAYERAMAHPKLAQAEWIFVADADEFLNLHIGDGTLDALFAARPEAQAFSFMWGLFGHSGRVAFEDDFVTRQFTHCADPYQQWPAMCRTFKTLYRADAGFQILSTHRPKKPARGWRKSLNWVDGDGDPMAHSFGQYGWHALNSGAGFGRDLGQINHYAVRSINSYLMKRLRGDVRTGAYHKKLEQSGVNYWALHCWNGVEDRSILTHSARHQAVFDRLIEDAELARLHKAAVDHHLARSQEVAQTEAAQNFTKTFKDYRGAFDWRPGHNVVTCPDLAFDPKHLASEDYRSTLRQARQASAKQARKSRRLPWFSNLDASGADLQGKAENPDLAPISEDFLAACPKPPTHARPKRRKIRRSILEQVGKTRGIWAVLGSSDPQMIEDVQGVATPSQLFVIAPWAYAPEHHTIAPSGRKPNPDKAAQDLAFLEMVDRLRPALEAGKMSLLRSTPLLGLKTLPTDYLDAVVMSGAMAEADALRLIERAIGRLIPGGLLIIDSYHRRGAHGDAIQRALHSCLGQFAGDLRIQVLEGAHCVVQKLPPLDGAG